MTTVTAARDPAALASQPLLDALDVGVILIDANDRVVYWNRWMAHASGIAASHARGRTLTELFGDKVSPALLNTLAPARQGMAGVLSNRLHRRPLPLFNRVGGRCDPMEQSVHVKPVAADGGNMALIQVTDVTSAVAREKHLRESEAALRLRHRAIEASSHGVMIVDAQAPDMPIVYANTAFRRITGYDPDEVVGRNPRFLHGEDTAQEALDGIRQAIAERREGMAVVRNYRKDGGLFWNELLIAPVFDTAGNLTHFVGVQRDISARVRAQAELSEALADLRDSNLRLDNERRFTSAILRTVGALVVVVDRAGRIVSFNRACEELSGVKEADAVGCRMAEFIPDPEGATLFRAASATGAGREQSTLPFRAHDGSVRSIRWAFTRLPHGRDGLPFLICTGTDVSERNRALALLRTEKGILEMVAQAEDLKSIAVKLCEAVQGQLPGTRASLLLSSEDGTTLHHLAGPDLPRDYVARVDALPVGPSAMACGRAAALNAPVVTVDIRQDPDWAPYREAADWAGLRACWVMPIAASDGQMLGVFAVYHTVPASPPPSDMETLWRVAKLASLVIERHRARERIHYLALHDTVTGLPNRASLSERLKVAMRAAQRRGARMALLFIDLDGFKAINDRYGHDAGDAALKTVAGRLRGAVRKADTAARIGGDEFVVLLEEITAPDDAELVAAKIVDAIRAPMTWHGETMQVGASIGISVYPSDATTPDAMLTRADDAMYLAKTAGKNRWRRYDPKSG